MSGSSDSSGGRTFASADEVKIRKLVSELNVRRQLLAGDHEYTPTGGQRGLMDMSIGATILPSVGRAGPGQRTEIYRSALPVRP